MKKNPKQLGKPVDGRVIARTVDAFRFENYNHLLEYMTCFHRVEADPATKYPDDEENIDGFRVVLEVR